MKAKEIAPEMAEIKTNKLATAGFKVSNCNLKPAVTIEDKILMVRGLQVMTDRDLAELYNIETKQLNLSVKRNMERFPLSFMFQLTRDEYESLRFQIATSNLRFGLPLSSVFTIFQEDRLHLDNIRKQVCAIVLGLHYLCG